MLKYLISRDINTLVFEL